MTMGGDDPDADDDDNNEKVDDVRMRLLFCNDLITSSKADKHCCCPALLAATAARKRGTGSLRLQMYVIARTAKSLLTAELAPKLLASVVSVRDVRCLLCSTLLGNRLECTVCEGAVPFDSVVVRQNEH